MQTQKIKRLTTGLVVIGFAASLTACTVGQSEDGSVSGEAHGSRVTLYSSIDAMAKDSSLVVVGTAVNQRVADDIEKGYDFTITTFEVQEVMQGEATSRIEIRQIGSDKQPAPAPLLAEDTPYLLFLTPSGLDGALASQYYVTGGEAGLYKAKDASVESRSGADWSSMVFGRVVSDSEDLLPSEVTPAELES